MECLVVGDDADLEQVISFDRPSSWWQKIIEQLSKSINLEQACSAALVCKSLTAEFEKRRLFKGPNSFLCSLTPNNF